MVVLEHFTECTLRIGISLCRGKLKLEAAGLRVFGSMHHAALACDLAELLLLMSA